MTYRFDHVHLFSRNPVETARYYRQMFDAELVESVTPDGKPRIDVRLGGLNIFIFRVEPGQDLPSAPAGRYVGLDHFGLIVDDLDAAVSQLKARGAVFAEEPRKVREGLRIAFLQAPENVRIEILERRS